MMSNNGYRSAEFVSESRWTSELLRHRGLIPVAIIPDRREVVWEDLGTYHCYEGFFRDSLATYRAFRKGECIRFRTSLEALKVRSSASGCLKPTAFIFHAGRSGSTLLTRILARSRSNMVFSEAPPHNQIWQVWPDSNEVAGIEIYRDLLVAMGRRRLDSHNAHIVKFTSFNIVHFFLIRAAFPGVPSLFLFRDPSAILTSCAKKAPGWMDKGLGLGFCWKRVEMAVEDFFRSAVTVQDANFRSLDYADLKPESLPAILTFLGLDSQQDVNAMMTEFQWASKSHPARRAFVNESTNSEAIVPNAVRALYRQLADTEWKLNR